MLAVIAKFNNIKLRSKLILAFLLVMFIPTLFVGAMLTTRFRQAALNNAMIETDNSVSRIKKLTNDILSVPEYISSYLFSDSNLEEVVNTRYNSTLGVVQAYQGYKDIHQYLSIYSSQISNIRLYIDNPTLIANWTYIQPDEKIENSFWYTEALKAKGSPKWFYIEDETKANRKYLSLVRRIRFTTYNTIGVLVISFSESYLNTILSEEPFEAFIVDSKNNIVASNKSEYMGKELKNTSFPVGIMEKGSGTFDQVIDGRPSKIVVEDLKPDPTINALKIVSIFSVDNILRESNQILIQGFIIVLICSVITFIVIYIVTCLLSSRITRLNRHIRRVAKGDLDIVSDISGEDEIGELSRQFNIMLSSIKNLISEVNESNRQKNQLLLKQNELRLKMMASQINPHFLFNALESIRLKALIKEEAETSQIIKVLGKLMRKKIEIYSRNVSLKSEVEMIRCYLEIEKYRYEERLNYELIIEPEAEEVIIPALIVQPIVENAARHGLCGLEDACLVTVKAFVRNDELHIEVIDNGEGIDSEKLENISRKLEDIEEHEGEGIGLHNVQMRLKLTYGEKYGLKIRSKLHEGTQVSILLPAGGIVNV